ncbi:unnamed protein product [Orchesella dallaii]|uniref:Uncharacterized protein n=1 Tax=Orchesella dallaii TaxID=48710 RepID=A0ABP1RX55_9HEXA
MNWQYLRTRPGLGKLAILVYGIVVLVVGLHSHFQSSWKVIVEQLRMCDRIEENIEELRVLTPGLQQCPPFELEEFFIAIVVLCFILSEHNLLISVLTDATNRGTYKQVDFSFHCLASVLLMIAGLVYIVSAEQIHELSTTLRLRGTDGTILILRRGEKITAGTLALIQAVLYGVTAFYIAKPDPQPQLGTRFGPA